jgi:hypothetical protein
VSFPGGRFARVLSSCPRRVYANPSVRHRRPHYLYVSPITMNRALYYIASVLCLCYSALTTLGAIMYGIHNGIENIGGIIMVWATPLAFAAAGGLFRRQYLRDQSQAGSFDKVAVISVIGIVCFIIGLTWAVSEIRWVLDARRMIEEVDLSIIERVLSPLILLGSGIYFGFLYPMSRANQSLSGSA